MEDFIPGLKFQARAGLKFCSNYIETSRRVLKFSGFIWRESFFGCLKKKYSMFVIYV